MKKVLIITHLLHASPRIPGLVRYLPGFGWAPVIITAPVAEKPDGSVRTIETGYRDALGLWGRLLHLDSGGDVRNQVKKKLGAAPTTSRSSLTDLLVTLGGSVINYPDSDKGWKPFALAAAEQLLQREQFDAIISSSSPVTAHIVARNLALRHSVPWVADLRDLWSQNHNYGYGPVRRAIDRRLELKTLSRADALVTVSPAWAENLKALHGREMVFTITNGFDPATLNDAPAPLTPKFTITYTGSIYRGKQDPSMLLAAVAELLAYPGVERSDVEVRFFGNIYDWLQFEIEQSGLADVVKQYGRVSHGEALERQRESQMLFLPTWEGDEMAGYSLKLFEYLAARRPVLASGRGNDLTASLLAETGAGVYCADVSKSLGVLRCQYAEYRKHGRLACHGDQAVIAKYSYRCMAGRFASLLDGVV